jgi:hypothetical protein
VAQVPIADGLFTWPAEAPRLIGSRTLGSATRTFYGAPGVAGVSILTR